MAIASAPHSVTRQAPVSKFAPPARAESDAYYHALKTRFKVEIKPDSTLATPAAQAAASAATK